MLSGFDIFPTLKANQPTNRLDLTLISLLTFVFFHWKQTETKMIKQKQIIKLNYSCNLCVGPINIDIVDFLTKKKNSVKEKKKRNTHTHTHEKSINASVSEYKCNLYCSMQTAFLFLSL